MKKADKYILIAIGSLLIISFLSVFIFKTVLGNPGAKAIVSQDGLVIHSINLSQVKEPYELTIKSNKANYNTIYVEKDKIKFSHATCPDQLCVQTGFLSKTGDIAVCLPHGLFIEIQGGSDGEIDGLAY